MSDLYSQEFLYHFKNQPNRKDLKNSDYQGKSANTNCGDKLTVQVSVENGIITDIGYESTGCAVTLGSMSILSDYLIGMKLSEAKSLTEKEFTDMLGIELTLTREKCALVGYHAFKEAIVNS